MVIERIPFLKRFVSKPLEVWGVRFGKKEDTGILDIQTHWTDKQPHPTNMSRYEEVLDDPETSIAINLLADLIAGVGFYTEMGEEETPEHKNKERIDEYCETVNLDEDLKITSKVMLGKGFCPVERLSDYDLKILPPETFFIWKNKKGQVYRYTQEVSNTEVARWNLSNWKSVIENNRELYVKEDFELLVNEKQDSPGDLEDIIMFINDEDPSHPYGKALVDPIVDLIDGRKQMNSDLMACLHRYGYPTGVMTTSKSRESIATPFEQLEKDEWLCIGNILKDELNWELISPEMRVGWVDFVELIYFQIAEALHAPLFLHLKNATEASAKVMMEAIDRFIEGRQRYIKRRVERFLFEPQCHEPVPHLVWGQPKTGLEEIELDQVANLYASGALKFNQVQDVLKQLGLKLPEPEEEEWEKSLQTQPFQPFQKKPSQQQIQIPTERLLAKLKDLGTVLDVINLNFHEKRIPLIQAMRQGGEAIEVYCKRMHPHDEEAFAKHRDEEFQRWRKRLVGKEGRVYSVSVGD